ncbi:MAG: hypothetical protein AAF608_04985 [Pseudomonadota bacterium]
MILTRLEERMIAMQADLKRIEKGTIPHGKDRMTESEQTNKRQWASIGALCVAFAALTGERFLPLLS